MKTVLKTAPAKYPITLKEAKEHLNIGLDWTEDDDHIETLIVAATDKAEQFLHRRLITQTWYAYYDVWPLGNSFLIPFGQLQDGTAPSVKYTDIDGDQTTWSSDEWNVDTYSDPGKIMLEYGYHWPTVSLHPQNPIVIEFVCGYGLTGSTVPAMIRHAIKLIISDLYENRETIAIGNTGIGFIELPTVKALLLPFKIWAI
jgi:uncharacterized phiE125 gp8 family phage protein